MGRQKASLQSGDPLESGREPVDPLEDPQAPSNAKAEFALVPSNATAEFAPASARPPELSRAARELSVEAGRPGGASRAPAHGALDVNGLRRLMRLTQRVFAGWFGFPLATLKHWERGSRRPTGSALVLLLVIHENPRVVLRAVRKARLQQPGLLPRIAPPKSYRAPPGLGERLPPRHPRGPRRPKGAW
jgi:putative transcriptional regulator